MEARRSATQPSRVPAQLTPRALNMYVLKREKTAPKIDRRKVFAAIAEAALMEICQYLPDMPLPSGEKHEGRNEATYNTR